MSNYFNDSKWKQYLKESNCGNYKREPEEEFQDHEGQMARSQLLQISKSAAELMQMIDEGDELPAWVQSKLTKAADYLKAAQSSEEYDELDASLEEDCWDGYERNPDVPEGEQGSCVKKTNEAEEDVEEGKICDAGIQYVLRTDPGGKDIHRGDEDTDGDGEKEIKNWSARAAQIASKKCKDPSYGTGKSKKKNEAAGITPEQFAKEHGVSVGKDGNIIVSPDQPLSLKAAEQVQEAGWSVEMKGKFLIISPKPLNEGGLGDWEKENWTHSDGTPCGGGDKDGSQSRCKPASKWKGMSKSEKAADNAKKKAGTKAGKQYVSATKKGKVTKAHTK